MDWLTAVADLRSRRQGCVIVTIASVRGHAPRNGGAKMVVSADGVSGTVGGGNLEATAVVQARTMMLELANEPALVTVSLSDKATTEFGVQCCGGEVTLLFEPVAVPPAVAIFGVGHVGLELARILSRHELDLFLVDSRADQLVEERLAVLADGPATIHVHRASVPEAIIPELPGGTHVLIMTQDHAEDLALCDFALRHAGLASIGLIGSSAKWARFRRALKQEGHSDADLERIATPIGVQGLTAKEPAAIAVSVAMSLLLAFEQSTV